MQPFILKDLRIALLSWEETYSETWCDQIALSLPQRFSASGSCWYSELKECFSVLISFMLMFPFYILWKHQKTKCWYSQMLWNMNIGNKMLIFFCLQYHIPIDKWIFRSNHPEVFCKKGVLRNFSKFTGKFKNSPLPDSRPATLLKRDSGTDVFLWILRNF